VIERRSGSCHCGAVRFSCDVDLEAGTSRCNCSACAKSRFWKAILAASDFRLEAGAEALAEYRFGSGSITHTFCRRCGVKAFGRGSAPGLGDFVAINVSCLDDLPAARLAALPVSYEDGASDRWDAAPEHRAHL
jgi:hypothetical protein